MKIVTTQMISELPARAAIAPRKRMNLNLHTDLSDPINRFLNAGLAGPMFPHIDIGSGRWELINVIQGRIDVVIFTSDGEVKTRFALAANGPSLIEICSGE